jgi:amino acid transporter
MIARRGSADRQPPSKHNDQLNLAEIVAIGVGGMVGGGIFATLGLAIATAGHAVALALGLGGIIALLTGYALAHLGLAFRDDGGSFTYIEHAFGHVAIAGIAGWLLVVGYVGTLALYATTFGAYGAALLSGHGAALWLARGLALAVLLAFLIINLIGAKTSGRLELVIVGIKLAILLLFAAAGLPTVHSDHLFPVFNQGAIAPVAASALIFVAYEGFELIPNAIDEMANPQLNLKRGLVLAILITAAIYIVVGLVAVGNLTPAQINHDKEYVLAVAALPTFGNAGFAMIGFAALLSTASAINATLFGAARLAMIMARDHALPNIFALRQRSRPIPYVALIVLVIATAVFLLFSNLTIISSFSSATFLIIFFAVNLSAWRLRGRIGIAPLVPFCGMLLTAGALAVLLEHMWQTARVSLVWIVAVYAAVILVEVSLVGVRGMRRSGATAERRNTA